MEGLFLPHVSATSEDGLFFSPFLMKSRTFSLSLKGGVSPLSSLTAGVTAPAPRAVTEQNESDVDAGAGVLRQPGRPRSLLSPSGPGEQRRLRVEGASPVEAGPARDSIALLGTPFKTVELFASGIFCWMCSDCQGPWVTETTKGEAVGQGEGLRPRLCWGICHTGPRWPGPGGRPLGAMRSAGSALRTK